MTEMDEATRKLSLFMLAGVCLGGAIVAVVSVVSSRNIVRPMLRLTEATRKVAAGDFESRVPEHYPNESASWPNPLTGWRIRPKRRSPS